MNDPVTLIIATTIVLFINLSFLSYSALAGACILKNRRKTYRSQYVREVKKKVMRQKGVSVYKLEQELGFAASTILKWKKSIPTVDKLKAVADYFKVPMEQLLENTEDEEG